MGESQNQSFQLAFNPALRDRFSGPAASRVTSDGGLIMVRELDERFGLGKLIEEHLLDSRIPQRGTTVSSRWPIPQSGTIGLQPAGRLRGRQSCRAGPSVCRRIPASGSSVQRRSGNGVRRFRRRPQADPTLTTRS